MTREQFRQYIKATDFKSLFITLGWNNYRNTFADFEEEFDGYTYSFRTVAQMKGYQVIVCDNAETVTSSFCKRLDHKLRPNAQHYICIFMLPEENGNVHHVWAFPIRKTEKRDMVLFEYHNIDQTELLYQKLGGLTFGINEQATITIADVRDRIYAEFEVNSEKLTKDFYTGFRKQHTAFCEFITGINDHIPAKNNREKQWYASVMLNRLMFCYFIQKKGFLDGDPNYLKNKLGWCQMLKGNGQFYSFYRSFLLQLFFGGLNTPKHNADFENEFGLIPYLNGGMFDKHEIEKQFDEINIPDEAFEQLFKFFDQWNWHLDTRVTASGRDINPDVLGYIFEQYINDRAQMGAYYTKEDITEYIGKNCILPFLMDRLAEKNPEAFKPDGYVWQTLRNSGDKYIYDAVKKGVADWDAIPQEIAVGIDTTQPDLLARRAHWNDRTPLQWGLPTEIWRETIERMQRCRDIQSKISNGEITHINDFITYNLDIRQFVQDLLEKTDDHLFLLHFNEALLKVTILDPTCGSGAFLFAAMNILEPLYETCVYRMKEFNKQNPNLFKANLEELQSRYRSNIQYYIYKTIILHNLYGVDIMHEATEIAKLRLFLKMVAVVDVDFTADNLGLDPLPDIDFNIRCGNTLVGYATEQQLKKDLGFSKDILEEEANQQFREMIETEMEKVAKTFDRFRQLQLSQDAENMQAFKEAKQELNNRLAQLNDLLNRRLYTSTTGNILAKGEEKYNAFLASHQPFHWLAEYYQIIHGNGGFDVIIGNPPYVEYNKKVDGVAISDIYQLHDYDTIECGNLYAYCIERSFCLVNTNGRDGMIIPISSVTTPRMKRLTQLLDKGSWISFYDFRPGHLFDGVNIRLCIFINQKNKTNLYTTKYNRWYSQNRVYLFNILSYNNSFSLDDIIVKISSPIENSIHSKVRGHNNSYVRRSDYTLYYHDAILYWLRGTDFVPSYEDYLSSHVKTSNFENQEELYIAICLFNSTLFYWFWILSSNCRDFGFDIFYTMRKINYSKDLAKWVKMLMKDYLKNSVIKERNQKQTGLVRYREFYPVKSKTIIDEIDKVLAKHYGFTEEELDYIINYDIKYRMGDELNDE
ncbi:MAG: Eco57I restriction-modification methylase domain-containing protein [Paludibacteraceae bacterium]|nr:Eco57I restriction-modification methylase domain-containing protein [Paludibacteraceae bacterium]MBR0064345.1 Eco57I restriction-modification methylase domain-containing protein [Paludibacteraceae bacterium]